MRLRERVHQVMDVAKPGDTASRVFDISILTLIALNVMAVILSTVEAIRRLSPRLFFRFEVFSVVVFTAEYALRQDPCPQCTARFSHRPAPSVGADHRVCPPPSNTKAPLSLPSTPPAHRA